MRKRRNNYDPSRYCGRGARRSGCWRRCEPEYGERLKLFWSTSFPIVSNQIERASKNGVKHVFLADAQDLRLPHDISWEAGKFDAVFSNATLHWCKRDPLGVLTSIQKVLKPGGRLAFEMGGFTNCIGSLFQPASLTLKGFVKFSRNQIHDTLSPEIEGPQPRST